MVSNSSLRGKSSMRIGWMRIAASLLIIAAPAGAALPDDGIQVCRELGSQLVYMAEAGEPFVYRLFHERIDQAREALLIAKAALDKSPEDPKLILAVEDAQYYFEDWTQKSVEMTLFPIKIIRVFRGNPAAASFIESRPGMKVEARSNAHFLGRQPVSDVRSEYRHPWRRWGAGRAECAACFRLLDASATSGGGTIYGALELEHANDGRRATPLVSTRIRLTAPGYADDVATDSVSSLPTSRPVP